MDPLTISDYALLNHPYKARMYQANAQNITGGTDPVTISFDTIDYDPAGMLTTGAGAKFTAPIAGLWFVCAHVTLSWTTTAGVYFADFTFTAGGARPAPVTRHDLGRRPQSAFNTTVGIYGVTQVMMSQNDTMQFGIFQNNTTTAATRPTVGGSALTWFEVHFLRPI